TLQLIAIQQTNTSTDNTHERILGRMTCRKGINRIIFDQIIRWNRRAQSECQYLYDVQNFFLLCFVGIDVDQSAAHGFSNNLAAAAQLDELIKAAGKHHTADNKCNPAEQLPAQGAEQALPKT